jgi:signal transduction histidine kinase/CheY-like chemotaxis protein
VTQERASATLPGGVLDQPDVPSRDTLLSVARSLEAEVRDLRTRLAAQQTALLRRDRLMMLGRLLAGIAHELANPLTALVARSAMVRMTSSLEDAQRHARLIEEQAQRAARIMRTVSTFARHHEPDRAPLDLNGAVRLILDLQGYQLATGNVTVVSDLQPELPEVVGDLQELEQVVLHVVLNAQDAIEGARGRGTLTIRTYADAARVWLSIRDDGPGMTTEVAGRLFEPFFTTKGEESAGSGLVMARQIVAGHGGELAVDTVEGEGTTVTIALPRLAAVAPTIDTHAPGVAVPHRGSLLVVDDESEVGELLADLLQMRGYETEYVASPGAALARIRTHDFQGVLMDLRMPEMSGTELWRELQRERPALALKTIFMTGDYASPETAAMVGATAQPYLTKPFHAAELDLALATLGSENELP